MSLILTRRLGETLIISKGKKVIAKITVFGVKGNQVRLGVDADRDIGIDREDIFERKVKDDWNEQKKGDDDAEGNL